DLLFYSDFRRLLLAQFLGQAADGFAQAVFAYILVLEPLSSGTPTRILALFVVTLLPYSLISPFLGVFVDRWSRRGLLVWTNVIRAAVLVTVPLWARGVHGNLPLYLSVLLLLGLGRLFLTTKGALLPVVLGERDLLKGNSLSGGGGMIAALAGGVVGVELLKVVTSHTALALAGVVYAGAAMIAARLSEPFSHTHGPQRTMREAFAAVVGGLGAGLRAISERPRARLPLIAIFVLRTIAMVAAIAAILIIKREFPGGSGHFSRLNSGALALGSAGVGAFVAALLAPFAGARLKQPGLIVAGFVVSGAGIIALGGIDSIAAVLGLTFVVGFGAFLTKVAVDAQVQEALPDEFRGRAFALYDILYNLASVCAGLLMVGLQSEPFRGVLIAFGILTIVGAGAFGTAMRRAGMSLT
ncbi:MAG: MFS transporter, partial [Actinomycetota bacterium]|nr:MFS transporter [Actinomycetota bacterium]